VQSGGLIAQINLQLGAVAGQFDQAVAVVQFNAASVRLESGLVGC